MHDNYPHVIVLVNVGWASLHSAQPTLKFGGNMPHKNRLDKISTIIANKKKLLGALRKGVEETLLKHKQLGKPIVVWKDNKAVWIPPEKIVIEKQKVSRRRK